jgi:hypothetical protein
MNTRATDPAMRAIRLLHANLYRAASDICAALVGLRTRDKTTIGVVPLAKNHRMDVSAGGSE